MRRLGMTSFRVASIAAGLLVGACDGPAAPPSNVADSVDTPVEHREVARADRGFDMDGAIDRARAAFFEHEGHYVAGSDVHRVDVSPTGDSFTFLPTARERAAPDLSREALHRLPTHDSTPVTIRRAASPLTLRTEAVRRGSERFEGGRVSAVADAGQIVFAREGVTEHLENTSSGLEQSWRFASRPTGRGDLEIVVSATGMAHVATTATGEHFADRSTGLGVVYGHGTFIDGNGLETAVPVQFEGGNLVLRVPAQVIDEAAYPAVLDPVLGPEVAVDAPLVGQLSGNQFRSAIASNGTNYLVVWADDMLGDLDIRGMRLNNMGALLDASALLISLSADNQSRPAVAWSGTKYIVAWDDFRNGTNFQLFRTTVTAAGQVEFPGGVAVFGDDGVTNFLSPALANAGANTLIVFEVIGSGATERDIAAVAVNADSAGVAGSSILVAQGTTEERGPRVAGAADSWLVTYSECTSDGAGGCTAAPHPLGVRVNAAFALVDATPFAIGPDPADAEGVAWNGGTHFVAMSSDYTDSLFATTVPVTGAVGTPATSAVDIDPDTAGSFFYDASIAFNGTEFLAAYREETSAGTITVRATRVNVAGTPLVVTPPAPAAFLALRTAGGAEAGFPKVAALGAGFYVTYTDFPATGSTDVLGTRVNGATVANTTGDLLSAGPNTQFGGQIASNGSGFLVAWRDYRLDSDRVLAIRLNATGAVTGGVITLSTAGEQFPSAIGWNGTHYVVVVESVDQDVSVIPVTPAGVAGTLTPVAATGFAELQSAIACRPAAGECLVVWNQFDSSAATLDTSIFGARVTATSPSVSLTPSTAIAMATGNQFVPAVAASASQYLVAYADSRSGTGNGDIYAGRFVTSGLDLGGLPVATTTAAQYSPTVASDGTSFLVAFVDERSGSPFPADLWGQRVNASGGLTGANVAISTSATANVSNPSAAFNGRYLVAFQSNDGTSNALRGVRVATSGAVADPTPFAITDGTVNSSVPDLTAGGANQFAVGYTRFETNNFRVFTRVIGDDDLPPGASCGGGTECASGFCTDGVCCSTECAGGTADCNACSVAAGGTTNGMCTAIPLCSGDAGPGPGTDAGPGPGTDAGPGPGTDAGPGPGTDAGPGPGTDAGPGPGTDAGPATGDAGPVTGDAGPVTGDAGPVTGDAGPVTGDAGPVTGDAGPVTGTDAGPATGTDAGPVTGTDAGTPITGDGGFPLADGGLPPEEGGCGCSVPTRSDSTPWPLAAGVLGLGLVLRRRRRQRNR